MSFKIHLRVFQAWRWRPARSKAILAFGSCDSQTSTNWSWSLSSSWRSWGSEVPSQRWLQQLDEDAWRVRASLHLSSISFFSYLSNIYLFHIMYQYEVFFDLRGTATPTSRRRLRACGSFERESWRNLRRRRLFLLCLSFQGSEKEHVNLIQFIVKSLYLPSVFLHN